MNILIAYHSQDNDGVFSAAIAKEYAEKHYEDCSVDLLGLNYTDIKTISSSKASFSKFLDTVTQYDVFIMTDISFNDWKYMDIIHLKMNEKFVWIDHHAPIINVSHTMSYEINGVRETDRSAILCMYKYLYDQFDEKYNKGDIPEVYKLLSGWDSFSYSHWNYSLDDAYWFNAGMNFMISLDVEKAEEVVKKISENADISVFMETTMKYGEVICKNRAEEMETIIKQYGDCSFFVGDSSHSACALFMPGNSSSLMFNSLIGKIRHGIVFKRNLNGTHTVSLYNIDTNDDFDCGKYLREKYHGGGHKGAAGCEIDNDTFNKIINTKIL